MAARNLLQNWKTIMNNKPNKVETKLEDFPFALTPLCQIDHWVHLALGTERQGQVD